MPLFLSLYRYNLADRGVRAYYAKAAFK